MTPGPSPLPRFAALSGTYFATMGLFAPFAPLWFQSLGLSTLAIGTIVSLQSWSRILAPYGWGWLGDHGGRRVELIRVAATGALLAALLLPFVNSPFAVTAVVVVLFLANGGVVPLSEASLAQLLNVDGRIDPARYGRVRVWGSVGFIAAVLCSGALLERLGMAAFPFAVVGLNALLVAASWRLPRLRGEHHAEGTAPSVLAVLRRPVVMWMFASIALTVLAHTAMYAFFSLYLVSIGYGKGAVGALWALATGAEILFFWFQGRWFWRAPAERWLQVVAVVAAARFATIAGLASWPLVLAAAQLAHAVTFAAHHSACISLLHRHFPGRLRGRGQALYTVLGYGAPGVAGGVAGAWLIEHLGYAAVFWAAAAVSLLALACASRMRVLAAREEGTLAN